MSASINDDDRIRMRYSIWIIEATIQRGVPLEEIIKDTLITKEDSRNPNLTVDWQTYNTICENVAKHLSSEEIVQISIDSFEHPMFKIVSVMGKQLFTTREFYHFIAQSHTGVLDRTLPFLDSSSTDLAEGEIQIEVKPRNNIVFPKVVILGLLGQFTATPNLLGKPNAEVSWSEHNGTVKYHIKFEENKAWLSPLTRLVSGLFGSRRRTQVLYEELQNEYTKLEEALAKQVRAETELQVSEQKYQLLADNLGEVIWTCTFDYKFTYISPSIHKLMGYTPEEFLNLSPEKWCTQESLKLAMNSLKAGTALLDLPPGGFEVIHKDGIHRWIEGSASVQRDIDGTKLGYIGVCRDITEKREVENQLRQMQKMESIGELAGGIAHDFNNLLLVIQGNNELLMDSDLSEEARVNAVEIENATERAAALTRQLLAFGRRQIVEAKLLNLNPLIHDLNNMLERLIPKHISFKFEPGEDLSDIFADPGHMEQIIINLAINARDAMETGGTLTIKTQNIQLDKHPRLNAGAYVQLIVQDTGAGISDDIQNKIFDPFYSTKPEGKGTGLGLSVVQGIVDQHDGCIELDSSGYGSKFTLVFPAHQTENIPEQN